ncbi:hypothetical protein COV11_03495 [Candidatus Woesearchaeota archaeon CG10_big_fil_rev_8_21_14_0_10_30_7]|nr:MAG: hypothetical protein COV11_03495 [Candidatus Woesearchaeota archaeon CG10_big_fil_rev_8_21_14_0_10_30_7]
MLEKFSQELLASLNPLKYPLLASKKISNSIFFVLSILLISCLLAGLLFWPQANLLNYEIKQELEKIKDIDVNGRIHLNEDIMIPSENPWLYATDKKNKIYNDSKIFIGPEIVKYTTFDDEYEFKVEEKWEEKKEKLKPAISYVLTFLLTGIIAIVFLILLIKYLLIGLIIGFLGYLLLDLTPFRVQVKKSFTTAFYAMIWIIPLEVITWPLGNNWLLPIKEIFYVKIYLLPLLLYLAIYVFAVVCIVLVREEKPQIEIEWN